MLRVAFAGTPDFAIPTIEALHASKYISLDCIYTQPDRPSGRGQKLEPSAVKVYADAHKLNVRQPESLKDPEEVKWFKDQNFDAMIVVAYGQILINAIITGTRLGCFNVHGSLLPRWRGAAPVQRAIEFGDFETGITIMLMDEGLDTGPILSTLTYPLTDTTTAGGLYKSLADAGGSLLVDTLIQFDKGLIDPVAQSSNGATYAHKLKTSQAQISWNADISVVMRHVHAFNPIPGAYTFAAEHRIKIFEVAKTSVSHPGQRGMLWSDGVGRVLVSTASAVLELTEIQLPGKKRMTKKQIPCVQNAPWHHATQLEEPQH